VELVEFGRLTDQARADVEGDEPDPFDAAGNTLTYRAKDRHVALRGEDGHIVASTGMLEIDVEVAADRFGAVGIGGVIVNARHRGRGLARELVGAALDRARTLGPRFALLFCHQDRAGLYERLGFAYVTAAVTVQQPCGRSAEMPQRTMWRALAPGATWPDGPVSVLSLPF
jgi:predicted N-acetyltransferase YhbS